MSQIRARFVVGTGRCGSTLLSRMLAQNAAVLSVFEFFSGIDASFAFGTQPVTGAVLADRLLEDHPMLTMVLSRGYEVPEVAYPFGSQNARFGRSDPIPWALAIAIARVSDEPDALFDALLSFVRKQPEQLLRVHYRSLLEWLTRRCGKQCWIEKSGNSMGLAPELKSFFPDARFVHLHRDGFETALSMREYAVLRLSVPVMYGELGEVDYTHAGLIEFERRNRDAIDEILATRPPIELYGRYWSEQVERGLPVLAEVDPSDVLDVQFEEMVSEPRPSLTRIAEFFEIPLGGWLDSACALMKGLPPTRFQGLSATDQQKLAAACRPGIELLAR